MYRRHYLVSLAVAILVLGPAAASGGAGRADLGEQTTHLQKLLSPKEILALPTKSPQPDTIYYDNNVALYVDTSSNAW